MNPTINPTDTPGLYRVAMLNNKLSKLLADPHPGLFTWKFEISATLEELATYCGTEVAEFAQRTREARFK